MEALPTVQSTPWMHDTELPSFFILPDEEGCPTSLDQFVNFGVESGRQCCLLKLLKLLGLMAKV